MRCWLFVGFCIFVFAGAALARDVVVTPLDSLGVANLLEPPQQGERIVMLWSLDCVYCEPNMETLAQLQRADPAHIKLVTVATDSVALADKIARRLAAADMHGYPAFAYTEPTAARLNFLLDPSWGGELPRTLVIRADGSRVAISGRLNAAQLGGIAPKQGY